MIEHKIFEYPPQDNRLAGLDHLRTLATLLVFMYHYGHQFHSPSWLTVAGKYGWTGVDLFFVLSGYLIASKLFTKIGKNQKISLKSFFINRFFRIVPAYLVVVTLYLCLPILRESGSLAPLWKYLTFTQNLGLDLRLHPTFSHAWSLCIEEQFYLMLPLILMALVSFNAVTKGAAILAGLFVAGFFARLISWYSLVLPFSSASDYWAYWWKWLYYPTYCRLDGLLFGVSIAALFQFKPTWKAQLQKYGNLLLLASLSVLTGALYLCRDEKTFSSSIYGFPLFDFGYGLLVLSALCRSCILFRYRSTTTYKLAVLSYSIYLIHKSTIHLTQDFFAAHHIDPKGNVMFLLSIIATVAGACLLNQLIEKPFLKFRERLLRESSG